MIVVSGLTVHPVKSLAGNAIESARLDRFGLEHDRRWLVVDSGSRFLSQRERAAMALIQASVTAAGLRLAMGDDDIEVARPTTHAMTRPVTVWEDTVIAQDAGESVADWISERLQTQCRLVYMPAQSRRPVDPEYAQGGETVSFADGFPLLLISQASLDDLNQRLTRAVPMNRFRPNLVVSGCEAFAEDGWKKIRIAGVEFDIAKPCARCVMPSIDQATGARDPEINRVLASYRRGTNRHGDDRHGDDRRGTDRHGDDRHGDDRRIYFGQNLLYRQFGTLQVGDEVEILA